MYILYIVCVFSLVAQYLAPYLVWANRWNVPTHITLGFCVTAYVIPGLLTDVWSSVSSNIFADYALINSLGATFMIFGILLGARWSGTRELSNKFAYLLDLDAADTIARRVFIVSIFGIFGLVSAYLLMGFVPIFAADPLSAKQFKGEYRDAYYRVAYLYRFSFWVLFSCVPILLACWWGKNKNSFLWVACVAIALIAASLARESAGIGVLTFLGLLAAWKRKSGVYIIVVTLIFPLGSAGYYLLGIITGVESFTNNLNGFGVFDVIAAGAPDILDQLTFLDGFSKLENFTWGRTILGGLVPGNFMWNPSVWTLTYDNLGGDISETVSGGLRLTAALWGYVNFSWFGVLLIPFFSGWVNGFMLSALSKLPLDKSLIGAAAIVTLYMTLGKQISGFYIVSIHNFPVIFCAVFFCVRRKFRFFNLSF